MTAARALSASELLVASWRKGVLSLNMLSDMSSLNEVRAAAADFARTAAFEAGSTYADYNPSSDKTAEYGLAGLVAGGAGVAVAKKLGLLGLILAFGKKFIVLIIAALGAIGAGVGRLMGRRRSDEEL